MLDEAYDYVHVSPEQGSAACLNTQEQSALWRGLSVLQCDCAKEDCACILDKYRWDKISCKCTWQNGLQTFWTY